MAFLDILLEGWTFRIKNKKTGIWRSGKFHYFKNWNSLCGKYEIESDCKYLLSNQSLWDEECCKECLKKLREEGLKDK